MPPDREHADWLAALDASLQDLGTAAPFPLPPIPEQTARVPSEPDSNGADGNGCDGIPDDRVVETGSGSDKPLISKELPAVPALPAAEKGVDTENEIETAMSRDDIGLMRARVNSKTAGSAGTAGSSLEINGLSLPDPLPEYPIIGYSVTSIPNPSLEDLPDVFAERAAIMEFDGGLPRAEAEARAFAACIVWTCGEAASAEDQLHAADRLKALGLAPPPRWRPVR